MLTKEQKREQVNQVVNTVKESGSLLFADFTKIKVSDFGSLRRSLEEQGVKLVIVKKRLLKIALQKVGVDVASLELEGQSGVVFIPEDILSIAGKVYDFSKEMKEAKKNFKVLGGYDCKEDKMVTAEEFTVLAKLPSREILLAQLASVFSMPIRKLAWTLDAYREKLAEKQS